MLIEDQYGIGDSVDLGVAIGSVERVTLRTTVLRGQDGTVWHVPNGEIRRVGNRSKLWSVAVLDVAVAYDADLRGDPRRASPTRRPPCARPTSSPATCSRRPEMLGVESVAADGVTLRLLVKTAPGRPVPPATGTARGDQARPRPRRHRRSRRRRRRHDPMTPSPAEQRR